MPRETWLALSYNVPINPSKLRVYVWRKLREIGAEYLRQGIAVLPNSVQNLQKFTQMAQKIRQQGGEATLMDLHFRDPKDEQEMTSRFKEQIDAEYKELLSDCVLAMHQIKTNTTPPLSSKESDNLMRMMKRYRKTKARDYFRTGVASGEIEAGLNELIDSVRAVAGDLGKQLRGMFDG